MDRQQALSVIKQTLDQAIKSGVCNTLQETQIIAQAFQTIIQELKDQKSN